MVTTQSLHGFSLGTISRELEVDYRRMAHWCEPGGIVSPARAPKERKQRHEIFLDFGNVLELKLISSLRKRHVPMSSVRAGIASLREKHPNLIHKIIDEPESDAPRAFLFAVLNGTGKTIDVLAVDLDAKAAAAIGRETDKLLLIDVHAEGRQIHGKLVALNEEGITVIS